MLWSSLTSLWSRVIPLHSYAHAHAQHVNIVFHSCSCDAMFWYSLWCNHVWCGPQSLLTCPHSLPTYKRASSSEPTPTHTHSCPTVIMYLLLWIAIEKCVLRSTISPQPPPPPTPTPTPTPTPHFRHIITLKGCNYALSPWVVLCSPQSSINDPQLPPALIHIHKHPLTYMYTRLYPYVSLSWCKLSYSPQP